MKNIIKKKRFWIGLSSIAGAAVYFIDGKYFEAAKTLLAGLAGQ